jgi:N-acetylmuramoyl-L-alanine amidase
MRRMRGYLNNLAGFVAVAIMAAAPLCAAQAADLNGARVWAGNEYTRLVLDASGSLDYKISQNDGQVVVDLGNSQLSDGFTDPSAQGLYRGMTHARLGDRLQLTAKVAPHSRLKSFVLKPTTGSGYRLVLDFYPGSGAVVAATSVTSNSSDNDSTAQPVVESVVEPTSDHARSKSPRNDVASARQAAVMLNAQRKVVVCIDAGHGGKDQGAHGPDGTLEKNVTLAVARDLEARINRQPGMKAVLTRDGDYFIELPQRFKIARDNKADLFVSIHADSYTSDDAKGSSVWVLSPRGKTNEAARFLADRENAELIGGTTLDDKSDDLAKVLIDLQQSWAIQASDVIAGNVLNALGQLGPTHRGYVERANFVVLRSPDVPSILVETAFISNPAEEHKLRDPEHQDKLAEAVMSGVKNYFESTPPPGTWFAAQAAHNNGVELASSSTGNADKGPMAMAGRDDDAQVTLASSRPTAADADVRDLHRVGPGESLRSIAQQYGISIDALKSANQINSDTVRAGTVLTIPSS